MVHQAAGLCIVSTYITFAIKKGYLPVSFLFYAAVLDSGNGIPPAAGWLVIVAFFCFLYYD